MLKDGVEDGTGAALLERGDELQRIGRVLDAAGAGEGGVVVVTAAAGMGKTKLLEAAVEDAAAVGVRTLVARAGELERGFAFGVVRQLVEAPVLAADDAGRAELLSGAATHAAAVLDLDPGAARDQDVHVTLHGLYWLLANLAASSALLVAVDDIQWADDPSVRWLAYVVRRLDRLRVAVIVTARTDPDGRTELPDDAGDERRAAIAEVLGHAPALSPELAPLSEAGVSRLLEVRLGQNVDSEFAAAARAQTGGNPFLVTALATEVESQGLAPRVGNAERLARVVPGRVGEMIRRHLLRVSPDARRLATSLAVLGEGGGLVLAAELAGLVPDRARAAAAELVTSLILADVPEPRFRHPLLRAAVESEASAIELAGQHRCAAELLAERGAAAGRIATHLLRSAPGREVWVVERLWDAARSARSQGAIEQAAAYLRRALAEPPPRELRAALLGELGEAQLASCHEEAAEPLREALELTSEPQIRADLTLTLALALYNVGRNAEAVDALLAKIAEIEGDDGLRERRLRLEAFLALAGRYDVETEARTRGRIQQRRRASKAQPPGKGWWWRPRRASARAQPPRISSARQGPTSV